MSSGTKKMSAFILRAIEMASLATQKRGIKCRSTTPDRIVRTILSAVLVVTGIRNVDHKRWIDDAGAEGLKKVKKEDAGSERWVLERPDRAHASLRLLRGCVGPLENLRVTNRATLARLRERGKSLRDVFTIPNKE